MPSLKSFHAHLTIKCYKINVGERASLSTLKVTVLTFDYYFVSAACLHPAGSSSISFYDVTLSCVSKLCVCV